MSTSLVDKERKKLEHLGLGQRLSRGPGDRDEIHGARSDPGVGGGGGGEEGKGVSLKQMGKSKSSKNMKKDLLKKNSSSSNLGKISKKEKGSPAPSPLMIPAAGGDNRQQMLKEIRKKQKEKEKEEKKGSPRVKEKEREDKPVSPLANSGEEGKGGLSGFLKHPVGLRIMRENRSRSVGNDEDNPPSNPPPKQRSSEFGDMKANNSPLPARPRSNTMDRGSMQDAMAQALQDGLKNSNGGEDLDKKEKERGDPSPTPKEERLKVHKKEKKQKPGSAVRVTTDRKIAMGGEAGETEEEPKVRKGAVYQFSKKMGVALVPRAKLPSSFSPDPTIPPLLADKEGYVIEKLNRSSSSSSASSTSSPFLSCNSGSFGSTGSSPSHTPPSSPAPVSSLASSSFSSEIGSVFLIDQDRYTPYYRHYFYKKDHNNYLTYDLEGSPILISVEKPPCLDPSLPPMPRRGFVRTCKPWTEDAEADSWVIITSEDAREKKTLAKELIELVGPKAKFVELPPEASEERFLKLEDALLMKAYKFGVLHCKKDQKKEEEIFNNNDISPDFSEFLDFLGDTVVLKGFDKFRGGLDVKNNTTGEKSVFTSLSNYDIMFHVGPMLPAGEDEIQQLARKRHIGNDIVVIIFLDSDRTDPIDPSMFVSDFNHVFCVVRKMNQETLKKIAAEEGWEGLDSQKTYYQIGFCSKGGIHSAEPTLCYPGIYEKNEKLKRLFLTKALNSERSALYAPKFVSRLSMVRKELFQDLANDMSKLTHKKGKWFQK